MRKSELIARGIRVEYIQEEWGASLQWKEGPFGSDGKVEGIINTKFLVKDLSKAIDHIMETAKRFEIKISKGFYLVMDESDVTSDQFAMALVKEEALWRGWFGFQGFS